MSVLALTNTLEFERWLLANHLDLFNEWELEACEWLELDEWLEREHWEIVVGLFLRNQETIEAIRAKDPIILDMFYDMLSEIDKIAPNIYSNLESIDMVRSKDYITTEAKLHQVFADKCKKGEWFELTEADIDYIKGLGAQDGLFKPSG